MSEVSKVLKVSNSLPKRRSKAMLEVSKVVFAVFMHYCIQSNVTHTRGVKSVLCIQWPLTPPGGKALKGLRV